MLHSEGTDEFPILVDITSGENIAITIVLFLKLALQFTKWGSKR